MKVIILGDGLLGSELRKQTGWDYISRKSHGFDFATDIEYYFNIIRYNEYDVVVNCIANTNTYGGSEEEHNILNHIRVHDLVNFCNEENIKLVHISTDYLYANSNSNAKETDEIKPIKTHYGQFKNYGDYVVEMFSKNFLTIRTSFKPNPFPYDSVVDQIGNFDYVDVISNLIIKLIIKDAKGIFNVGTEKKTMLELALRTNKNAKLNEKTLNPLMPKDITMNIKKMESILYEV